MPPKTTVEYFTSLVTPLKVMGFMVMTIKDGKSVTKPTDILFLIFHVLFGIFICFLTVIKREDLATSKSEIADYGNFIAFVAATIVSIICMLVNFVFRHRNWDMIVMESEVEMKFSEVNYTCNYTNFIKLNTIIDFLILSLIIPLCLMVFILEGSLLKVALYFYSSLYFVVSIAAVTGFILGIYCRLCSLTEVLNSLLHRRPTHGRLTVKSGEENEIKVIETTATIYQLLMDICDDVNLCYGTQLLFGFGAVYFYTLLMLFTVYKDLSVGGRLTTATISSGAYGLYFTSVLTGVIMTCSWLESEAEKVKAVLKNLLKQSKDPLEISILIAFSCLLKKRSPKITCGLFDIDWNLFYSIFASALSNFVILMQFDWAARQRLEV